jgi:hypothetical protein
LKKHLRDALLPFIILALASFIILVVVDAQGDDGLTSLVASILLVIVSFIVSVLAIWKVAKGGLIRNDKFLMLNTNLAVSLLIFALGEVSIIALYLIGESSTIDLIAGVVQLVAVGLWSQGVLVYLLSTNRVLGFARNKYTIPLMIILIAVFYLIVQGLPILFSMQPYSVGILLSIPIEIGLTLVVISMVILLRYYRGGYLAIPTLLTILGTILLIVRVLLWGHQILGILEPTSQIIAGAGYLLLGASLSFKSEKLAKVD